MNDIIVGVVSKEDDGLKEFLLYIYGNIKIIQLEKIEEIKDLPLLESPDIIFLCDKYFSPLTIEKIKKIKEMDNGISTAIFYFITDSNKQYVLFDSNVLYSSKKERFFPDDDILETVGKIIRKNKVNLSLLNNSISIADFEIYLDMINLWDSYTKSHCIRTQKYTDYFLNYLKMDIPNSESISQAAMLHDIGKISISKKILSKPSKLTALEYEIIKTHPLQAERYLQGSKFSEIKSLIVSHHENYDGSGYPYGLTGEEIPLGSYIIGLADSLDAMTSNRGYNKVKNLKEARKEIAKFIGKQFHPLLGRIFIDMMESSDFVDFSEKTIEETKKEKVLVYKEIQR